MWDSGKEEVRASVVRVARGGQEEMNKKRKEAEGMLTWLWNLQLPAYWRDIIQICSSKVAPEPGTYF